MSTAPEARLARAVLAALGPAELLAAESREWLSATFAGRHHRLGLLAPVEAGRRLATLPPETLHVPGEVVVDMAVVASVAVDAGVRLTLEARTVCPC